MLIKYFTYFVASLCLCASLVFFVKNIAVKYGIVDKPDDVRKKHQKPIPLLGGIAIFFTFWILVGYLSFFTNLLGKNIHTNQLVGVFLASLLLMIVGFFDDRQGLSPKLRFCVSVIASVIVIIGGVSLNKITNPFGSIIPLDKFQVSFGNFEVFNIIGDTFVFLWLLGMMYTTKILDGLDGLASGITAIGSLMIFFLSNTIKFSQPDAALVAIILFGACVGFLFFNFNPAKIFLGEGGSLFLGLVLGVLAIISGGKLATALLVMALPILDLARVAFVRAKKKQSIFKGDREHLHFLLVDTGLSQKKAVIILYAIAFFFGIATLFLQSKQKLFALLSLVFIMIVFSWFVGRKVKQ